MSGQSITRGPAVGRESRAFRGRIHSEMEINYREVASQHRPGAVTEEQLRVAFGDFVRGVGLLALGEAIE